MRLELNNKLNQLNSVQQDFLEIMRGLNLTFFFALIFLFCITGSSKVNAQESSNPSIIFSWQSGNVPIIQSVEGIPDHNLRGSLSFENRLEDHRIVYEFSERKNNETPKTNFLTSRVDLPGFAYIIYGANYTFGRWVVGSDNDYIRFDLNFPDPKRAVEQLQIGDVVKAIATIKLVDTKNENAVVDSEEVVITINGPQRPEIEFSWEDSQLGIIKRDPSVTDYDDLKATWRDISFRSSYEYRIKSIEQKNNDTPNESVTGVATPMFTDFSAEIYGQMFEFGNWYFATDDSKKLLYRPDADAIKMLDDGDTVTSKIQIEIFDTRRNVNRIVSESPQEIVVYIRTGSNGNLPRISYSWNSSSMQNILQSSNEFGERSGLLTLENFDSVSYSLAVNTSETKDNITIRDSVANHEYSDTGFVRKTYGAEFVYGEWFVEGNQFSFQPTSTTIDGLDTGDSVVSKLRFTIVNRNNNIPIDAVTIQITIVADKPTIQIRVVKQSIDQTEPARFILDAGMVLQRDLTVLLDYSDSAAIVTWRVPRFVTINQGKRETEFQIQLNSMSSIAFNEETILEITIAASKDYHLGNGDITSVFITKTVSTENQARISVANLAASAIIEEYSNDDETTRATYNLFNPVTISMTSDRQQIEEGESVEVYLHSSSPLQSDLSINVQLSQAGNFLNQVLPNNLTMENGHSIRMLRIETVNDNDAELDGQITAEILSGKNYQVDSSARRVEIKVSDLADREFEQAEVISAVNGAIIPRITEEIGDRSFNVADSRFNHVFEKNQLNKFNLNGVTDIMEILSNGNYLVESRRDMQKNLLGDSSFTLELFPNALNSGSVEVWGKSNFKEFSNLSNEILNQESGYLFTGYTGIDYRFSQDLLLGVSTLISESQAIYDHASINEIQFNSNLIGVHPYIGWNSTSGELDLQVSAGYGSGEIEIAQEKYESETLDSLFTTFAVSGRKGLINVENNLFGNQHDLSLNGESWYSSIIINGKPNYLNQMQSQVSIFRLYLKGEHQLEFENGSMFEPELTLGIRGDQVDQKSVIGMEATSSVNYQITPELKLMGQGNLQIVNEDGIANQFIKSEIDYSQGVTGLGLKFTWESSNRGNWNASSTEFLKRKKYINDLNIYSQQSQSVFNSEFQYGLSTFEDIGIITPFTRYTVKYNQERNLQFGSKLDIGQNVDIELINQISLNQSRFTNQQLALNGIIKF